jgi:hypothetical protein
MQSLPVCLICYYFQHPEGTAFFVEELADALQEVHPLLKRMDGRPYQTTLDIAIKSAIHLKRIWTKDVQGKYHISREKALEYIEELRSLYKDKKFEG